MDKTFLIISTALFLSGSRLFAQAAKEQLKKCESDSIDGLKVYSVVDHPPEYQGAITELYRIFGENLAFPKEEDHMPISSKFYISFVIDTTGSVRNLSSGQAANIVAFSKPRFLRILRNFAYQFMEKALIISISY